MNQQKTLLLAGGSGFIGNAIGEKFAKLGWKINLLTRTKKPFQYAFPCQEFTWDGTFVPQEAIDGVHVVINLAGQGIADEFWTAKYRDLIFYSRIHSTRAIRKAIESSKNKPQLVIQASAVGYYGMKDRPETCVEETSAGKDFLAEVCQAWEYEAKEIAKHARLVISRLGVVLGWEGGALKKLWDIYATGFGAYLGHGKQWMNWIHIKDVLNFFEFAIDQPSVSGIYNLVAPENISNLTLHHELAKKTSSLKITGAPKISIKTMMGERASLLLEAPKVVPQRLNESQFKFEFSNINEALEHLVSERTYPHLHYLKSKQWVPANIDEVWDFVSRAENLERITPPWLNFRIVNATDDQIQEGTKINYSLKLHGFPMSWRSCISRWKPKFEFVDEQEKGPYSIWYHRHLIQDFAGGTLIEDRIDYKLPLFPVGEIAIPFVKKDLEKIFSYRKKVTADIFQTLRLE